MKAVNLAGPGVAFQSNVSSARGSASESACGSTSAVAGDAARGSAASAASAVRSRARVAVRVAGDAGRGSAGSAGASLGSASAGGGAGTSTRGTTAAAALRRAAAASRASRDSRDMVARAGVAASEALSDARVTKWAKTLFARALMVALHKSVVVPNTKICSARPQLYKISTNVGAVVVLVMPI